MTSTSPAAPATVTKSDRAIICQPDGGQVLHAFGGELRIMLTGAQSGNALAMGVEVVQPGGGPPPHVHRKDDEMFIMLDAGFEFFTDGAWTPVAQGGMVYLPREVPHTFRNAGSVPARIAVITTPSGFEHFFSGCADIFAEAGPASPPDLGKIERTARDHGIEFLVPLGGPPSR